MAFRTKLAQRFFNVYRCSNSRTPLKAPLIQSLIPPDRTKDTMDPKPGDSRVLRRILQRCPLYQSTIFPESLRSSAPTENSTPSPAVGGKLIEKLREMDIARGRLRLDGLISPLAPPPSVEKPEKNVESEVTSTSAAGVDGLTVKDVKKLLKASQIEMAKEKLRQIPKNWIDYSELVKICAQICGDNRELGLNFAKMLDDSGSVIVLGDAVCLRPEQDIKTLVVKAIQGLIPLPLTKPNDPRKKQFAALEKQKAEIDSKAEALVRRELWAGLGYFVVQTAAFMRLTFWELSWDVMEPICFYVTSMYCMAGYTFFLRTAKEPSFEGFFQSRFSSKQKKLMKANNFDLQRYNELKKICYPAGSSSDSGPSFVNSTSRQVDKTKFDNFASASISSSKSF